MRSFATLINEMYDANDDAAIAHHVRQRPDQGRMADLAPSTFSPRWG
ncbi:hypothetical protein ACH4GK_22600 [Streptomyces rimosus]|nr:hypothetical protein [Streptomyces rimosus]